MISSCGITLSLDIPLGTQIDSVEHLSPDLLAPVLLGDWTFDGSLLEIMLDELLQYSLVVVNYSVNGDFNGNGIVDGADFLMWQPGASPNSGSSSDLDA
jgi:hypothetical protein